MFGVVMIGGYSRRMGRDKYMLTSDGRPWLERRAELLSDCGLQVCVSGRGDQSLPQGIKHRFIADNEKLAGRGIYSALISSLESLKEDALFIPVDMDNSNKDLIQSLIDSFDGKRICCFIDALGNIQAFPCIVPYSSLHEVISLQTQGIRFRHYLAGSSDVQRIESAFDSEFRNFNSQQDLER